MERLDLEPSPICWHVYYMFSVNQWCSPKKNEVGERLEIEVETVAKSAILQEFSIV